MKLYTSKEMQQADSAAVKAGMPSLLLMENAGRTVAEIVLGYTPKTVLVLCGKGNNGGDGYVVARHLHLSGCKVDVLELAQSPNSQDSQNMRSAYLAHSSTLALTTSSLQEALKASPLVIDALFGSGLHKPLNEDLANYVEMVNQSNCQVISIDVPSGIDSDAPNIIGAHIKASETVQLAGAKLASAFYPARSAFGKIHFANIGIPEAILEQNSKVALLDHKTVRTFLTTRDPSTHKYDAGTVLIIGGSQCYGGAAALACHAALRGEAGLVTLASKENFAKQSEIIFESLEWSEMVNTLAAFPTKRAQVRVIGPGLAKEALNYLPQLIKQSSVPTVLDASALMPTEACLDAIKEHSNCVLTPHVGEASKLLSKSTKNVLQNPIKAALELSQTVKATVVLKSATTVIAAPKGRVAVSTRGHKGMATGGSGDALAGLIGAYLHNGNNFERSCAAVYIHGLAGEIAAKRYNDGLLPSDLINYIPEAVQSIKAYVH